MDLTLIYAIGGVVVALVIGIIAYLSMYKTVAPDKALIITGDKLGNKNVYTSEEGKRLKIIRGGGTVVIPFIQQCKEIETSSIKLEVKGEEVITQNGVPITVEGTTLIKVGNKIEEIATASEQFPGGIPDIQDQAKSVLEGHLRSILASMTVEDVYKDRTRFAQDVQKIAVEDINNMGLQIVSFTIREVRDKNGYLEALGKKQIAEVKKQADVATAEADKETRIKRADAEREARQAEIDKETAIAEKTKEMELKKSAFKEEEDRASAKANQSYSIQEQISKREVVEAEMEIQKIEKERLIELQEKEIERKKKELEATVKNQADADLYQRQKAAEASRFEEEQKAQAEAVANVAKAKANAEAEIARAEAEALAEKAKGIAEAEVEKAKGQAEAEAEKAKMDILRAKGEAEAAAERARIENLSAAGLAEASAIEAKGMAEVKVSREKAQIEVEREMGLAEAAIKQGQLKSIELITKALPEMAKNVASPMANVDKITIVDTGNGEGGMTKMSNTVTNIMHTLPTMMKDIAGIDLGQVLSNVSKGRISNVDPEISEMIKEVSQNPEMLKNIQAFLGNSNKE